MFCKVPSSHYAHKFAGFPLAFVLTKVTFFSLLVRIVPSCLATSLAAYIRICFKFNKWGTGNIQAHTFHCFDDNKKAFALFLPWFDPCWDGNLSSSQFLLQCFATNKITLLFSSMMTLSLSIFIMQLHWHILRSPTSSVSNSRTLARIPSESELVSSSSLPSFQKL